MRLPQIVLAALILVASLAPAWAGTGGGRMSPSRAGEIARQQTGGRVLAVKPADGGYQVKVLTPSGQVVYVFVPSR
jgi:hypothetical protein